MKLKRFWLILLSTMIITSLLLGGTAYAQEEEELPDPGITPDSPFYFLDNWGKQIGLLLAFGPEAKAQKALEYAEERLAEANAMALKNRIRETERAADSYNGFLAMVRERAEEAKQQGVPENISEKLALATSKHLAVLDRIKDNAPEQAKESIVRARESSIDGQQNALRALSRERLEKAMEINLATIEGRLNRVRVKADEGNTGEVEAALDDTDKLFKFGEEISETARGLGKDTTSVEQLVARATAAHLEVLTEVHEKVPEPARVAIESAIANSLTNRERVVEALKSKGALGEIPEEAPVMERVQAQLLERVQAEVQQRIQEEAQGIEQELQERVREELQERLQEQVKETLREQITNLKPAVPKTVTTVNKTAEAIPSPERIQRQRP